jgi:hypothetical protein
MVVALAALGAMATSSFADVQNIRLSGDIRIRGYYLANANGEFDTTTGDLIGGADSSTAFISQRTRISVEADLEDHVLVVVTLSGESLWGGDNEPNNTAGAGTASGSQVNRAFDVGVSEAYVQLNEVFYTGATLKIGRQYLNYGRGLIISSHDQAYNFDAGRVVLDFYPVTIDILGAMLVNTQSFSPTTDSEGAANLLFVNARYEMTDSFIKSIEAYYGWTAQMEKKVAYGSTTNNVYWPTIEEASPMVAGLRLDLNLSKNINAWAEGCYEFGQNGDIAGGRQNAWLANAGIKIALKDTSMTPTINANYTFASGSGTSEEKNFIPWFDYVEGQNGYVFSPTLSNINIFNVGASIKPYENTTLAVQAYYYLKCSPAGGAGSNPNIDVGGISWSGYNGGESELGTEIDAILGYDYSKDVRFQLIYGIFIPGQNYTSGDFDTCANEVRAEVFVKF